MMRLRHFALPLVAVAMLTTTVMAQDPPAQPTGRGQRVSPPQVKVHAPTKYSSVCGCCGCNGQPVDPTPKPTRDRTRKEVGGGLGGLVPGRLYGLYEAGVARKIPAGADIVLQMHYTTIGEPITDQTQIGVVLAMEPPTKLRAGGGGQIPNASFAIPAGHANYEVVAKQTINRDTYLSTMYPHMHVRGKDVSYTIAYPDGREEVVLNVPKYDFNWQLNYRLAEPKFIPGAIRRGKRC